MYAHFESSLCKQVIEILHHTIPASHTCGSFIFVKYSDGWYFEPLEVNIGDDATEKFSKHVLAPAIICMKWLTQEQWRQYDNATNCTICIKPFKSVDKKIHDHDNL